MRVWVRFWLVVALLGFVHCAHTPPVPAPRVAPAAVAATPAEPKPDSESLFITSDAAVTQVEFLCCSGLVDLNFDKDPFLVWLAKWRGELEDAQPQYEGRQLRIQFTLHKNRAADFSVAARPALTAAQRQAIVAKLQATNPPTPRFSDVSMRITLVPKVSLHNQEILQQPFVPQVESPQERLVREFKAARTPQRLVLLKEWADSEVLPVIAALLVSTNSATVQSLGKQLAAVDFTAPLPVAALTDQNPSYWSAQRLLSRPAHLAPVIARVFMHVHNGELDQVAEYLQLLQPFVQDNAIEGKYLTLLHKLSNIFQAAIGAQVREGIALHDQKKYAEALGIYERVTSEYPCSADALYEAYFSRATRDGLFASPASLGPAWYGIKDQIFRCRPMYPIQALSRGAQDKYRQLRRLQTRQLMDASSITSPEEFIKAMLKLADIALDLGEYGFAAQLYWELDAAVKKEVYGSRELTDYWLYALEQLGVTAVKGEVPGDHAAAFQRIAEERRRLMQEALGQP